MFVAALLLALVIGGVLATAVFALSRASRDAVSRLGRPTPEEARVVVDAAVVASHNETSKAVEAIKNANTDDLLHRVDWLRSRGRSGK